jgi:hypothetical protein
MKKNKQKQLIIEMMQEDEKLGLYQKEMGIRSRIRKFIHSSDEIWVLIIAYLFTIGLSIAWSILTTK